MPNHSALEKYHSMIKVDSNTGKNIIDAKDILSLPWQEYAKLITMRNLPQVDRVMNDAAANHWSQWILQDVSMKQTIAIWLTASVLLISSDIHNPHKLFPALIGFMSWVVIEYGYHRFVGHMPVTNELAKYANFYLHGKQHFAPKDLDHVLLSPFFILISAIAAHRLIFSNITQNPQMALAFTILHYLLYDTMHYAMHKFSLKTVSEVPLIGNMLVRLWGHHERHHKEPECNFAVTTGGLLKFSS